MPRGPFTIDVTSLASLQPAKRATNTNQRGGSWVLTHTNVGHRDDLPELVVAELMIHELIDPDWERRWDMRG